MKNSMLILLILFTLVASLFEQNSDFEQVDLHSQNIISAVDNILIKNVDCHNCHENDCSIPLAHCSHHCTSAHIFLVSGLQDLS